MPSPVFRKGNRVESRDTNPPTKHSIQKLSCLQEMEGQSQSKDYGNGQPTGQTFDPSHGQSPIYDTVNDALLCLQIKASLNYPLRDSTQELTKTDAETHGQRMDRNMEVLWKSWKKD